MVDLLDPQLPAEVGYYSTPGRAWGVALVVMIFERDLGSALLFFVLFVVSQHMIEIKLYSE